MRFFFARPLSGSGHRGRWKIAAIIGEPMVDASGVHAGALISGIVIRVIRGSEHRRRQL
jgi:hypothetical protein